VRDIARFCLEQMADYAEATMANRQAKVVSSDDSGSVITYRGGSIKVPSDEILAEGSLVTLRYTDGALSIESESAYR